jgi:membrane-associated phospholipid phosphatase
MKLNKTTIFLLIILVTIYNNYVQNSLEKMFFKTYYDYKLIKRPHYICQNKSEKNNLKCAGMPSGHAETSTLFLTLLYFYEFIPIELCIFIIILVSIHRIITHAHTIIQVLFGILFGYAYAKLYNFFNFSLYSFLTVFGIGILLLSLIKLKTECNLSYHIGMK